MIVSRTGYTGEKMAYELFVHPERAAEFWQALMRFGEKLGIKAIGLGARDSLRTEAGLPLYGHEMGDGSGKFGQPDLGIGESGFIGYVKFYKPWFIGREALIASEEKRKGVVVRFRFAEKGVRMAHNGDPVLDKRGKVIGWVTSCAVDAEGYLDRSGVRGVEVRRNRHADLSLPVRAQGRRQGARRIEERRQGQPAHPGGRRQSFPYIGYILLSRGLSPRLSLTSKPEASPMRVVWLGWEEIYTTRRVQDAANAARQGLELDVCNIHDIAFDIEGGKASLYGMGKNLLETCDGLVVRTFYPYISEALTLARLFHDAGKIVMDQKPGR